MTIIQFIMNTLSLTHTQTHAHTRGSTHSISQPQEPDGEKKQMQSVTHKHMFYVHF